MIILYGDLCTEVIPAIYVGFFYLILSSQPAMCHPLAANSRLIKKYATQVGVVGIYFWGSYMVNQCIKIPIMKQFLHGF